MNSGDSFARDKLVEHNLRLVAHIIKKYYAKESEHDDLVSIGTIGLIKAVNYLGFELKISKILMISASAVLLIAGHQSLN